MVNNTYLMLILILNFVLDYIFIGMKRTGVILLIVAGCMNTAFAEQCKGCDPVKIVIGLVVLAIVALGLALGIPFLVFYSFNKFSKVKRKNFAVSFLTGFVLNLLFINLLDHQLHLFEINSLGGFLLYFFSYIVFCILGYYISPKRNIIS
jgi:thiol:disulfide interchange protein